MAFVIVDGIISIAIFIIALVLNLIHVDPLYIYPETLPSDAPRRNEFCQVWLFFVLIAVIPLAIIVLQYDFRRPDFTISNLLYPLIYYLFTVSLVSIICSSVHLLIGTPRPDSVEQCRTVNVSYWTCSTVLSKSQLVSQFHSFPSIEAALAMASAVFLGNLFASYGNSFSELLSITVRSIPYLWAVMVGSLSIALSMYRISDVLAGFLIGFIIASWASSTINHEETRRGNRKKADSDSGVGAYEKPNI